MKTKQTTEQKLSICSSRRCPSSVPSDLPFDINSDSSDNDNEQASDVVCEDLDLVYESGCVGKPVDNSWLHDDIIVDPSSSSSSPSSSSAVPHLDSGASGKIAPSPASLGVPPLSSSSLPSPIIAFASSSSHRNRPSHRFTIGRPTLRTEHQVDNIKSPSAAQAAHIRLAPLPSCHPPPPPPPSLWSSCSAPRRTTSSTAAPSEPRETIC